MERTWWREVGRGPGRGQGRCWPSLRPEQNLVWQGGHLRVTRSVCQGAWTRRKTSWYFGQGEDETQEVPEWRLGTREEVSQARRCRALWLGGDLMSPGLQIESLYAWRPRAPPVCQRPVAFVRQPRAVLEQGSAQIHQQCDAKRPGDEEECPVDAVTKCHQHGGLRNTTCPLLVLEVRSMNE